MEKSRICSKCKKSYSYLPTDAYFDERGYGYSTKLVNCPYCGVPNVIKHIEDRAMKKLNRNGWEYGL